MKIIAGIYLVLLILTFLLEPMLFGKEKPPYSFENWLFKVVFNAPLLWLLWILISK